MKLGRKGWKNTQSRKWLSAASILFLTLLLLELCSTILFRSITGVGFSLSESQVRRLERLELIQKKIDRGPDEQSIYVFHPYVGYIGRSGALPWGKPPAFNEFGMLAVGERSYPYVKQPDEFVVGILGGSVAEIFAHNSESMLQNVMSEAGFGRKLVLINLATGGYKQPQQLNHFSYALLSGFEFDAVINIDGFNDIVFSTENLANSINPLYPSALHLGIMSKTQFQYDLDYDTINLLGEFHENFRTEEAILSIIASSPLRFSPFWNLLSEVLTNSSRARAVELNGALAHKGREKMNLAMRGPKVSSADAYETGALIWRTASEMLHELCRQRGIAYLHILQPNQYVEGSKPLSEKESRRSVNSEQPWGAIARQGYPYLLQHGRAMKQAGLPFFDLTMVFAQVEEDLYSDDCCHFNARGNQILAQAVARILVKELQRQVDYTLNLAE